MHALLQASALLPNPYLNSDFGEWRGTIFECQTLLPLAQGPDMSKANGLVLRFFVVRTYLTLW